MEVLYLTIFLSFTLAVFFLFLFIRNSKTDSRSSPEQSSLIPFRDEETPDDEAFKDPRTPGNPTR